MPTPPFSFISPYFWSLIVKQIAIPFLLYTHLIPVLLAVIFGTFLLLKTKKLSSFYLFLVCIFFSAYSLLDLATWIFRPEIIILTWSLDDLFSVSFFISSYWFLFSFIKDRDIPLWQKAVSTCTLIPTIFIIGKSINMNTFYAPSGISVINQTVLNYNSLLELFFIIVLMIFLIWEHRKAQDELNKRKIVLAGSGVALFLLVFFLSWGLTNFLTSINFANLANTGYLYDVTLYSFLGMPILLAFLGYLIAKYQAFDVKLIKSIALIVILAILLFIGLFLV